MINVATGFRFDHMIKAQLDQDWRSRERKS